jgi:hypothetical protein
LHVSKRYTKTKQYYLQDKASVSHFCFWTFLLGYKKYRQMNTA